MSLLCKIVLPCICENLILCVKVCDVNGLVDTWLIDTPDQTELKILHFRDMGIAAEALLEIIRQLVLAKLKSIKMGNHGSKTSENRGGDAEQSVTTVLLNTVVTALTDQGKDRSTVIAELRKELDSQDSMDFLPEFLTDTVALLSITFSVVMIIYVRIKLRQNEEAIAKLEKRASIDHDRILFVSSLANSAHPAKHYHMNNILC